MIKISSLALFIACAALASEPPDAASFDRARQAFERDPGDEDALRRLLDASHAAGGLASVLEETASRARAKPRDGRLRFAHGQLLRQSGDCDAALAELAVASDLLPSDPGPHLAAAECHRSRRDGPRVLEALGAAEARTPSRGRKVELIEAQIGAALDADREDLALAALKRLVATDPSDLFARMRAADRLARASRLDAALAVWRDVVRLSQADPKVQIKAVSAVGTLLERLGRGAEAVQTFKTALKRLPEEHWATLELQEGLLGVYRAQGKLADYVVELEKGRRSYPVLLTLARLYEELGDDKRALAAYRTAVKERPANVDARTALLRILRRAGTKEELAIEYRRLIERLPGEPSYELELAEVWFDQNKSADAFALLDKLSKHYASDPGIHESILDLLLRHEADRARIEREFTTLTRLEPDEPQHIIQLGEYWFGLNERGKAVATWTKVLKTTGDKAKAHLTLATIFADHEMVDEAIENFREAVKLKPKEVAFYKTFALYLEKVDRYADAFTAWQKIIELSGPRDRRALREAREHIVTLFKKQGTLTYKLDAYRRRFEATPPDLEAGIFLAEAYITLKDFARSAAILEKVVKERPNDLEALVYMERVYEKLNRRAEAIDLLGRIVAIDAAERKKRLRRMARLSLEIGRLDDAVTYAQRVVDLSPADAKAVAHLGDVYHRAGDEERALAAYRKSLDIKPQDVVVAFKRAAALERLGRTAELTAALLEIVKTAKEPSDITNAGRRLIALGGAAVEAIEPVLLVESTERAGKPVYRRLLIELYSTGVRRLAQDRDLDPKGTADRLRALAERGLKPLLDSLADPDLAVRTRVLRILVETRNAHAVLPVARLLDEPDQVLKVQALMTLAHLGASSAIASIEKATRAPEPAVVAAAIWSLGAMADKRAGEVLAELGKRDVRRANVPALVALALGMRGLPDGYATALHLFLDGPEASRAHAAWALGAIGDARATEHLLRRMPLEAAPVRRTILWSLGTIGSPKALDALIRAAYAEDDAGSVAVAAISRVVSPSAIDRRALLDVYLSLRDFEAGQVTLTQALGALMPEPGAIDGRKLPIASLRAALSAELASQSPTLKTRMLRALAPDGDRGIVLAPLAPDLAAPPALVTALEPAVVALVSDRDREVRRAAVHWLGAARAASGVEAIAKALDDRSPSVRREAARALGRLGAGLPRLLTALSEGQLGSSWTGRAAFAEAAGRLGAPAATIEPLLADTYPEVRVAALGAANATRVPAERIASLVADADRSVSLAAIRALGAMKDPGGKAALEEAARHPDPDRRRAARLALDALR